MIVQGKITNLFYEVLEITVREVKLKRSDGLVIGVSLFFYLRNFRGGKMMDSAICRVCGKKFFYERKQGHRRTMCSKECVKEADRAASRDWYHRNFEVFGKRASGKKYKNPPEKLQAIKEKYKNGVTLEILEEWLGG